MEQQTELAWSDENSELYWRQVKAYELEAAMGRIAAETIADAVAVPFKLMRFCPCCHSLLPEDSRADKVFCNESCRNTYRAALLQANGQKVPHVLDGVLDQQHKSTKRQVYSFEELGRM